MGGTSWSGGGGRALGVGITQDLILRRKEARRAQVDGSFASTASEALVRQMRGLAEGLPRSDRALLLVLQDQVRKGQLPLALQPPDEAEARGEALAHTLRSSTLDRAARSDPAIWAWAAALQQGLADEVLPTPAEARHARIAALTAAQLADAAGVDAAEAFLGGLLHDVGRVYLHGLARTLKPAPRPVTVEQIGQGLHPAVGAVLCEAWDLSAALQLAIEHHHQPLTAVPRPVRPLARVVQASHALAEVLDAAPSSDLPMAHRARALERHLTGLGLEPDLGMFETVGRELAAWEAAL